MPTCPSCGHQNRDGARFCEQCASPLAGGTGPVEERKVVTVLFCDLVGFTASSERADPEDVRARIDPYFAHLRASVEAYQGTVDKFIGDAVMAVFGAPTTHEDDPERAVRAALRILEEIAGLNEADPTLGLTVRIGVNTGEVLARLGSADETQGLVTGDVVNTASRLQTMAPEGGVVVSASTHLATKDVFDFEALPPVTVKGKSEPLPIWRVRSSRARFGTDLMRTHTVPLVGREDELELLKRTFARCVRDSSVQLLTIVGEPGVGKSRMVAELFHHVESLPDLITWRQGRCLPYGEGITFWALGEVLKAHAGILESDPPEVAATKLDRVLPEGAADREWFRQRLSPLLGLEATASASREESFTAWRRFLEHLAEPGPAVLVFEDLHWADPAMLDFLEHTAEYAEGVPLLLVATARPELFERRPGWGSGRRNASRISLSRLSDAEIARLIGELLDSALLPAQVQSLILDRAGGNPLYAEEFVRMLSDRELLVRKGKTWELAPGAEVPYPQSISALIASRLDTLSSDRKSLLADAAVLGKVFWSGALAEMGARDPAEVSAALHELSRKEFIRPARTSSMQGEAEYSFWHALIRDVAYGQVPRAARSAKHRAAASWIERMAGDRVEDHAEILASHYTTALDLARAAGQLTDLPGLRAHALRYLTLAGDRALSLDVAAAEARYAAALALTPPGDPGRPEVLVRSADALRQRGHLREATEAYEEAIAGFREHGTVRSAAVAMGKLALNLRRLADPRRHEVVAEAVALLGSMEPGPELVEVYSDAASQAFVAGQAKEAVALSTRAIELAASLGLSEPVRALGYRGGARCDMGDAGGLADLRRALELALAQGQGRDAAVLYNNLAFALWSIEGPAVALRTIRDGAALSERRGCEELALSAASSSLDLLVDLGRTDEVMALGPDLAGRAEAAGSVPDLLQVRWAMTRALAREGRFEEAAPLATWIEDAARRAGEPTFITDAFPVVAMVQLGRGQAQKAVEILRELEATPGARQLANYPVHLPDAIRTALAAGAPELAERLAAGLHPVLGLYVDAVQMAQAHLTEHAGRSAESAEAFARAAERWSAFEMPWERAQALLGCGRCLLALGRAAEASTQLHEAREIFVSLGARTGLSETDTLLERSTATTS